MSDVVIFIGLQASGKTSFYRERFAATHRHISKDLWPNARHPAKRQKRCLDEALAAGASVVVDNTNATREMRAEIIGPAKAAGARVIGYYFESRVADCLARNEARDPKVPPVAIYSTISRLERPMRDEGFDELHYVTLTAGGFDVRDWHEA